MAWSDRAREAAKEARRRKARQKVVLTNASGRHEVSRSEYAKNIRNVRGQMRHPGYPRSPTEKRHGQKFNYTVRQNAAHRTVTQIKNRKREEKRRRTFSGSLRDSRRY
jgi:hypothetical protein